MRWPDRTLADADDDWPILNCNIMSPGVNVGFWSNTMGWYEGGAAALSQG